MLGLALPARFPTRGEEEEERVARPPEPPLSPPAPHLRWDAVAALGDTDTLRRCAAPAVEGAALLPAMLLTRVSLSKIISLGSGTP